MVRKSWVAVVLAATAASSVTPTAPAAAATDPNRSVGSEVGTYAIIGPDNRLPVNPTTSFPASATVLLTFAGGRCTGFMISARTVATAGHCVHTGAGGTWRTNVVAYPGYDGTAAPYGSCTANTLFAVPGWTNSSDPGLDYGAVRLNCAIGNTTGWFGIGWTTESLVGTCTVNLGYPNDKPNTQWRSEDYIRAETATNVYHQHDAVGGQDGSPVFLDDPDDWCPTRPRPPVPVPPRPDPWTVLAIHTSGPIGGGPGATNNIGTRITQPAYNNLMSWR